MTNDDAYYAKLDFSTHIEKILNDFEINVNKWKILFYLCSALKDKILNLSEEAKLQLARLDSALQERKLYEEDVMNTNNWNTEAEGFIYSDILSSNYNVDNLQQQLVKVTTI